MTYHYRCEDCGLEFDDPAQWQESRGEFWGFPAYETCFGCPNCKGSFDVIEDNDDVIEDKEEQEEEE